VLAVAATGVMPVTAFAEALLSVTLVITVKVWYPPRATEQATGSKVTVVGTLMSVVTSVRNVLEPRKLSDAEVTLESPDDK
jgi:hypothetical protein